MTFSQQLNAYIEQLDCSARDLAEAAGLSASLISRYRSGERTPAADSDQFERLCEGIRRLSATQGGSLPADEVRAALLEAIPGSGLELDAALEKLERLMETLDISNSDLARALHFDASFISRILARRRRPADPERFFADTAAYVSRRFAGRRGDQLAALLGCTPAEVEDERTCAQLLRAWFADGQTAPRQDPVHSFLSRLDELDLNEYIRAIRFDELRVPTVPFQLPTSRTVTGLRDMMASELAFLRTAATSRSREPVIIYSDMPMGEMARDPAFPKKWMFGMAAMLKKGLHLNMIHNVDRPMSEMMLGLESYIPMYMTGQISPWYLRDTNSGPFRHLLEVAGTVALSGEAVEGHHAEGRYHLTANREEVRYYRARAEALLKKASPLMDIYRADGAEALNGFLQKELGRLGACQMRLATLPLFTLPAELLDRILSHSGLEDGTRERIRAHAARDRELFALLPPESVPELEVPEIGEEEFTAYPLCLSLSGMFLERDVVYTWEEYREHFQATADWAAARGAVLRNTAETPFRNIQITIRRGRWVMVSKNKAPAIHFVIRHPRLVRAIEDFLPPVRE